MKRVKVFSATKSYAAGLAGAFLMLACQGNDQGGSDDSDSATSGGNAGDGDGDGDGDSDSGDTGGNTSDGGSTDGGGASSGGGGGVNTGGQAEGGMGGMSDGAGGDSEASGGADPTGGSGGTDDGVGGSAAGGAGPLACSSDEECEAETPFCEKASCVECLGGADCASGACAVEGSCISGDGVVYAHADDGSADADCGSMDKPCLSLVTAAEKLSPERPHLVALPGSSEFVEEESIVLSGDVSFHANDVWVFGEENPMFSTTGSVRVEGLNVDADFSISEVFYCEGGSLSIIDSSIFRAFGMYTENCSIKITGSHLDSFSNLLHSECSDCSDLSFELSNSLITNSFGSLHTAIPGSQIIGNVFYKVSFDPGENGILLDGDGSIFAFNTIYDSGSCDQEGVVACLASDITVTSNISFGNVRELGPCTSRAFFECDGVRGNSISSTLAEKVWAGDGNQNGDPLLSDPENRDFSLQAGSPAIDMGDPAFAPSVDYLGNPRSVGAGPDAGAIERQ